MMRRLFPAPLLSAALVVLWLLLNESWSVGHVLLALLLGLLLPVLFASLRPQQPLTFFMLRERQINAFATLGGYVGMPSPPAPIAIELLPF